MEQTPQKKLMEEARQTYRDWDRFVTVREGDSRWTIIRKRFFRVAGIIVMIILSPFLFLGLFIAFIAVF